MSDTDVQFHAVATTSEVDEGEVQQVSVGRTDIALYKLDGDYYATDDICSHAYASLADGYVEDGQIECPLHGACFDIKTGKALTAPANVDLKTYPVKIEGDKILVGVPTAKG
ncbi:MAG: bifunctional 3-phenylpropionate/cinnamic acid dioxygenase ferredoxin subunit [Alphaproteobacteria bacterium]